jgi:hypothetical protein
VGEAKGVPVVLGIAFKYKNMGMWSLVITSLPCYKTILLYNNFVVQKKQIRIRMTCNDVHFSLLATSSGILFPL